MFSNNALHTLPYCSVRRNQAFVWRSLWAKLVKHVYREGGCSGRAAKLVREVPQINTDAQLSKGNLHATIAQVEAAVEISKLRYSLSKYRLMSAVGKEAACTTSEKKRNELFSIFDNNKQRLNVLNTHFPLFILPNNYSQRCTHTRTHTNTHRQTNAHTHIIAQKMPNPFCWPSRYKSNAGWHVTFCSLDAWEIWYHNFTCFTYVA